MKHRVILGTVLAVLAVGCGKGADREPPFATPALTITPAKAALGSPVELTYRFTVQPDARKLDRDYRVFVHFVDDNQELMWTDDHTPPVPTTQWAPGQVVQYTRTVFIPIYPFVGEAAVELGLYRADDPQRVPLAGEDRGQRAYKVATLQLLPQTDNVFLIYKDGWHPAEVAGDNAVVEWQWTKRTATIAFRNPRRNVRFYLHVDAMPQALEGGQSVTVAIGDQVIDTFSVPRAGELIRKIPISAAQLGEDDMTEVRLQVDRTFVPADLPAFKSRDPRELGIRVFHAFVEPQ